jgi:hypothetical protein
MRLSVSLLLVSSIISSPFHDDIKCFHKMVKIVPYIASFVSHSAQFLHERTRFKHSTEPPVDTPKRQIEKSYEQSTVSPSRPNSSLARYDHWSTKKNPIQTHHLLLEAQKHNLQLQITVCISLSNPQLPCHSEWRPCESASEAG